MLLKKLFLFLVAVVFLSSCDGFNKLLKSSDHQRKLQRANVYYDKKQYNKALILYENILPYFKATEQYDFVFYRFAYCAYYTGDNYTAQTLFKEYIAKFPQNEKVDEMDYMHALSYYLESPNYTLDQANTIKAMGFMQAYINTYPGSSKIKDAMAVLEKCKQKIEQKDFAAAELYLNAEQYQAASIYFNQLVQEYSESIKAEEYKTESVKSLYLYALYSIEEKQIERFQKAKTDAEDFLNRFPESKYLSQINSILSQIEIKIKTIEHEYFAKSK